MWPIYIIHLLCEFKALIEQTFKPFDDFEIVTHILVTNSTISPDFEHPSSDAYTI